MACLTPGCGKVAVTAKLCSGCYQRSRCAAKKPRLAADQDDQYERLEDVVAATNMHFRVTHDRPTRVLTKKTLIRRVHALSLALALSLSQGARALTLAQADGQLLLALHPAFFT